jgi:hypothetical protein
MGARSLTANLSAAGFVEDVALGFSVPFGGWGCLDADGVDLSEGGAASTTFFLSPTGCGGLGVKGRGEGAAVFCVVQGQDGSRSDVRGILTLDSPFVGAQRCSRFLRLAWYLIARSQIQELN